MKKIINVFFNYVFSFFFLVLNPINLLNLSKNLKRTFDSIIVKIEENERGFVFIAWSGKKIPIDVVACELCWYNGKSDTFFFRRTKSLMFLTRDMRIEIFNVAISLAEGLLAEYHNPSAWAELKSLRKKKRACLFDLNKRTDWIELDVSN